MFQYIVIEGPIGVGKTSLTKLLAKEFNARLILEKPEENPFLPQFYHDRKKHAFQAQIFFLLNRFQQQKEISQFDLFNQVTLSDYLFAKDRIFASLNLDEHELALCEQVYGLRNGQIPTPDLVIYLQARPEAVSTYQMESLYKLAVRNIRINELDDRVRAVLSDVKHLRNTFDYMAYDLVVSNPPFRKPATGRLSIGRERAIARHELALKFSDLAAAAAYLLKIKGRFFMIYHPERLIEVFEDLRRNRLEPKRIRFVHNDPAAESKIVLIEAVRDGKPGIKSEKPLYMYHEDGSYTAEVSEMYGDGR